MQTDESETQDEQENKTFILSPGQSTEINGVAFTLVKIAGDSRCPLDVTCIWAGAVTAQVSVEKGGTHAALTVTSTDTAEFTIESRSYTVSIKDVLPAKETGGEIDQKNYKITFEITKK